MGKINILNNAGDAKATLEFNGSSDIEVNADSLKSISSTDNAIARFDGTTGQLQDSGVTIDDSGNVGIGTSSPAQKLHVEGSVLIDAYQNGGGLYFREGFENTDQPSITITDHSGAAYDGLSINSWDGTSFNVQGSERMRITSSGSVGIGTSIPVHRLSVDAGAMYVTNYQATPYSETPLLIGSQHIYANTNYGTGIAGMYHVSDDNLIFGRLAGLSFKTSETDSAPQERMRIDSAGRVTMPYQPAFSAYLSSNSAGSGKVVFDSTLYNRGNAFNTSTGYFTAPVSGVYSFTLIVTSSGSQGAVYISLSVNDNRTRDMIEGVSFTTNTEHHATCEVYLSANDTASISRGAAFTMQGGGGSYYSAFMGHLQR